MPPPPLLFPRGMFRGNVQAKKTKHDSLYDLVSKKKHPFAFDGHVTCITPYRIIA